ncbi:MAG: CinA family protein [Ahrensia sp.]|nr:CinA family protein [Ahrensia sp.]
MSVETLAAKLVALASQRGVMVATAESCTGGLIAASITEVPGSSAALDRGFVTYSNPAKIAMLGVPESLIAAHGAVSAPVAEAMAQGALNHSDAQFAVAVTGIAGPGGGTAHKPVGLVYVGVASTDAGVAAIEYRFQDAHPDASRAQIRALTVDAALTGLLEALQR